MFVGHPFSDNDDNVLYLYCLAKLLLLSFTLFIHTCTFYPYLHFLSPPVLPRSSSHPQRPQQEPPVLVATRSTGTLRGFT